MSRGTSGATRGVPRGRGRLRGAGAGSSVPYGGARGAGARSPVPYGGARARLRLRSDSGQVAVEFLGMAPTIIVTLVLMWQCVLLGYTFTLAGNAADEGARVGTAATGDYQGACERAALGALPGAWHGDAAIDCGGRGSGYVTATVHLRVPVLLPGLIGFPIPVSGHAAAVEEVKR